MKSKDKAKAKTKAKTKSPVEKKAKVEVATRDPKFVRRNPMNFRKI